jgi:putative membrane protein
MNTRELLMSAWDWQQPALAVCVLLTAAWLKRARPLSLRQRICFGTAMLLAVLALVSPIAVLGEHYLLSAHMLQHFILVMIFPPLLLASLPERVDAGGRISAALRPTYCWVLGIAAMALWHVPTFFDIAMRHASLHLLEQVSFVATALAFWWPVFGPGRSARLHPVVSVVYLATACICCTVIGVAITFARTELYPMYLEPADHLRALSLIRDGWGISPRLDQQLGGLLMWVPGCLVYLSAMLVRLLGWFAETDSASMPAAVAARL